MFQAQRMLFIYVESPLHVGGGRSLGAVDLPIQRERTTGYPMVQASSLKGKLRALGDPKQNSASPLSEDELWAIFGPETNRAQDYAGALAVGDARLLLFPVRSLAGVFAWTTSVDALARFLREAKAAGLAVDWKLPPAPEAGKVWVSNSSVLEAGESVVLEEFSFESQVQEAVATIAAFLAKEALPRTDEYRYWRDSLPRRLCILPEDAFRDFTLYATEVQTHIKLNPETKTVETGALFTSESLPVDSLLYAPLMASQARKPDMTLKAEGVLTKMAELVAKTPRVQLGGDETTGQGLVALRLAGGGQ